MERRPSPGAWPACDGNPGPLKPECAPWLVDHGCSRPLPHVGRAPWSCRHAPSLPRSEEHTSELQSLMRISYAVFCLKKKIRKNITANTNTTNLIQITTQYSDTTW